MKKAFFALLSKSITGGFLLMGLGGMIFVPHGFTAAQAEAMSDQPHIAPVFPDHAPARVSSASTTHASASVQSVTPIPAVQAMMSQVTTTTVQLVDGGLSGEWPVIVGGSAYTITSRNTTSGEPITKATQYAYEWMQASGLVAQYHTWSASGYANRNVIGQITGQTNPNKIYLITAHLDNMPYGAEAHGADDNASGSTAVLLAAQILSQYSWDCTLRFALWTGEEQYLLGSGVYAADVKAQNENILGVLNLDMIAWNSVAPNTVDLYANSAISGSLAMAQTYSNVISAYGLNLAPNLLVDNWLGYYSDNASFWTQGYPAILAIEHYDGDFNAYYHTVNDRLQYLDLDYFANNVKAAIGTLAHTSGCLSPKYRLFLPNTLREAQSDW